MEFGESNCCMLIELHVEHSQPTRIEAARATRVTSLRLMLVSSEYIRYSNKDAKDTWLSVDTKENVYYSCRNIKRRQY